MVSRDTTVHAAVLTVALAATVVLTRAFPDAGAPVLTFAVLVLYGFVLAGAHLVLAWRGEDGVVPVASRWRFVALVATVLALGGAALVTEPASLGPLSSNTVLAALAATGVFAYWVVEARAGYAEATGEP